MFRCDALGPYHSDDSTFVSYACRDFEFASGAQKADIVQTGWTLTIEIPAVLKFLNFKEFMTQRKLSQNAIIEDSLACRCCRTNKIDFDRDYTFLRHLEP